MYFQYCGFSQDRNIYGLLVAQNDVKMDADSLSHGTKTSLKSWGLQPVQSRAFGVGFLVHVARSRCRP